MSDKNIDKILAKVKKLLALGDASKNNSEAEAQSAMLKAQSLLAEYNLSIDAVMDKVPENEYATEYCHHKWDSGFRIPLAVVLSKNFRCETFMSGKQIAFMGHPLDVKICKETFEYAYDFIYKRATQTYNQAYQLGYRTKGVFNSYAEGFIVGLKEALEQQSTALMIIVPPDVTEEFHRRTEGMRTHEARRDRNLNRRDFEKGRVEGKDFMSKKKLEVAS